MFKVKMNQPNLEKGAKVTVSGLGELVNGETVEFDDEAEDLFKLYNGDVALLEAFTKESGISVTHSKGKVKAPEVAESAENTENADANEGGAQ